MFGCRALSRQVALGSGEFFANERGDYSLGQNDDALLFHFERDEVAFCDPKVIAHLYRKRDASATSQLADYDAVIA
jgi:hypothetical protein